MPSIAILGAGAMGSALATPLRANDWDVRLWGTWLDDHLLDACEKQEPHPRTKVVLAPGTRLFRSHELEAALAGADIVVCAVASQGVAKVIEMALPGIVQAQALLLTSKGFISDENGTIELLPDAIRRIAKTNHVIIPSIVAIGGPCKANEIAEGKPTATIYGCLDEDMATRMACEMSTGVYCIEATSDEVGVEVAAPMKNIYAIALGVCDGLEEGTGFPHHNLKSATFAQAVREMSLLSVRLGARPETAYGLAGAGDLEVTGLSGRNKIYGVRIGRGEPALEALDAMIAAEQTVEGVPAADLAQTLVSQSAPDLVNRLPLLAAATRVINGEVPADKIIAQAVLPQVARPTN